ncbi:glycosyltransferase [Enterobacter hormaechei]|uniref:glycosyltransferase n=1 Tax=Enterobacter hormaechei TaxID=158836 RepID=UPI0023E47466|nr:glycosyltransferase [Enterobacter hormaechei]MCE1439270.1 glycosyltransferase [Enterobacter hormaechei]MDF3564388.1 glycosyltransferase [Enterobacter hormaechei]MEB6525089.1 glycosyltransferase [Enterobacter hormaechei]HBM2772805.1 glycosyltransferase [Enterobacter hormaechei subsp. xiangfangensis]
MLESERNYKVAVLLSTYNGMNYITEQLASLSNLFVDNYKIDIHIRDDGSSDDTVNLIKDYIKDKSNIFLYEENNIGVIGSFLRLVQNVDGYDFYAFCDQDDHWDSLKLMAGVSKIQQAHLIVPMLYCSAYDYVDSDLNYIGRFVSQSDFSIGNLLIENCAPGCTMLFNSSLRDKFNSASNLEVEKRIVMHDWLFLLLAAYYGQIIYDRNSYLLYRQHANNVIGKKSGFLSIIKSKIKQFKREIKRPQHLLYLQTQLLSEITANDPTSEMHRLSNSFIRSQKTFISRVKFICKGEIKRVKKIDDVIFKILYIFGYYK